MEHQHSRDVSEDDLTGALSVLYGLCVRVAGECGAAGGRTAVGAMDVSDLWVGGRLQAGGSTPRGGTTVVASFSALREGVEAEMSRALFARC